MKVKVFVEVEVNLEDRMNQPNVKKDPVEYTANYVKQCIIRGSWYGVIASTYVDLDKCEIMQDIPESNDLVKSDSK